jgi:hypothetical protein
MAPKFKSPVLWSLMLVAGLGLTAQAQPLPDDPTSGSITAGMLQEALFANCVEWRLSFGPLLAVGTYSDLDAGDEADVRLWVGGEDARAELTYRPRADGSVPPAVTIGRESGQFWCRPAGRLTDDEAARLLAWLCLPFDCDLIADDLGVPADTPLDVQYVDDVAYYVLWQSSALMRWIDAAELTVEVEVRYVHDRVVRTEYNEWDRLAEHGWYPALTETSVDDVVATRLHLATVEPRPDLVGTFASPDIDPALLDADPWGDLEGSMEFIEPAEDGDE